MEELDQKLGISLFRFSESSHSIWTSSPGGDKGVPVAVGEGPVSDADGGLAKRPVSVGMA